MMTIWGRQGSPFFGAGVEELTSWVKWVCHLESRRFRLPELGTEDAQPGMNSRMIFIGSLCWEG